MPSQLRSPLFTSAAVVSRKTSDGEPAAALHFVCYGVRVRVEADDASLLARLAPHLPFRWRPTLARPVSRTYRVNAPASHGARGEAGLWRLRRDDEAVAADDDLDVILETFESDLRLFVAEKARRRVFVHAGVAAFGGRAVVIPGRSFSGKTSLVAALVRAGAVYYSDEYAVFDARGLVHPYLKPLALRRPGQSQQVNCPVEALGGVAGRKPLPVALIVSTRYDGRATWQPEAGSAGAGLLALLDNTVPARHAPQRVMDTLARVVAQAETLCGPRGEAAEAARTILRRLSLLSNAAV